MIIKEQKKIIFINDCNCVVDENLLREAIVWYQDKPTAAKKHIYMHGKYPCVSIHKQKIHIHRLLMMYIIKGCVPKDKFVHHENGIKTDCRIDNLKLIGISEHQSLHNKGKEVSDNTRKAIIKSNHSRKGKNTKYHRPDVTPKQVYDLKIQGMSFNHISKILKLDWSCCVQRFNKYIHDNPELLKDGRD